MSMYPLPATDYVGVDVAKDSLAVCSTLAAKVVNVPNCPQAMDSWLAGLPAGVHLLCEATGRHHRLLQQRCALNAIALTCLNPAQVRAFAKSLGTLEKTDPIDARVLLRLGIEGHPAPSPVPSDALRRLGDLLMARHAIVEQISAFDMRNNLLSARSALQLKRVVRALRSHRLALELDLQAWLYSEQAAPWLERIHTLCFAPGVGILSALSLIAYLPELGSLNRRQIAKLAGLAPLPWDSGKLKGLRIIQGGRAPARRVLYQCAMVAARWHEPSRLHYQQLRARGKPPTVAYVAIARKLLIFLNSLLRPAYAAALPS
ncbi:IS110 family transposase [Geminisphaera colitermitum]|uniref:IS110 family transposase n=1 Tax=Geminisphaera colitermitum TaxID=1148786 RepID=UPI0002D66F3F|nr:IS110 family transposase [Geminisphaera colitermitum]